MNAAIVKNHSTNAILKQHYYGFGAGGNRTSGNDDVLGTDSHDWDLTIFVAHRRQAASSGGAPLSFSVPAPINDPDSRDGALALAWRNIWQDIPGTMTAGIGAASTGPSGTTWTGPAAETAPAQAGFQITTLTKANTTAVDAANWTYSAELTLRNRNLSGATESSKTVTTTVPGGAPRYALGRLLVAAGVGQGFLHGDIAEVIIFVEALSTADRQAVEDHLASAYPPSAIVAERHSDFGYTGHYYHQRSKLHLAPFRAYDAELGRWISRDPLEQISGETPELAPDGPNLYGYVRSSPILRFDPLGDQSMDSVSSNPSTAVMAVNQLPHHIYLSPAETAIARSLFGTGLEGAKCISSGAASKVVSVISSPVGLGWSIRGGVIFYGSYGWSRTTDDFEARRAQPSDDPAGAARGAAR